jgi:RNA polymerase sigma-70 factor (ECF subfamily)
LVQSAHFRALFDANVAYVWNTLGRLGLAPADRDDGIQEVFLHVHDLLADYDPSRPIKPWLFAIAYRVALQQRRKHGRRREQCETPTEVVTKAGAHDGRSSQEARELVARALASIDIHRRAVFVMKELDGYDVPEIAEALGIPLNTAYSRLRVARDEFRHAVTRLEGGLLEEGSAS